MAEVAVGVLHNVGNALNSVNVSARMAREVIGKCRIGSLQKAAALLADAKDLPAFVLSEKGRILPGFLVQATGEVAASLEKAGNDLATLQTHVDHIKRVVSTQQAFARVKAHVEEFDLAEAVEAAVQLSATTASKRGARITSRIPRGTLLVTDKHRVVQILLNLVSNACHAVADVQSDLRRVEISADAQGDRIVVRVRDQGAGISPDVMKQLFRHGFTTRKDGHGFGLHSSANAATEVGGSLRAESDGADRGATFVLDIPREMAKEQSAAA
jgi:C4-dicarboxylate-specific signal transduction histidine kinase